MIKNEKGWRSAINTSDTKELSVGRLPVDKWPQIKLNLYSLRAENLYWHILTLVIISYKRVRYPLRIAFAICGWDYLII